jgi:hypothetical protein
MSPMGVFPAGGKAKIIHIKRDEYENNKEMG